MDISPFSVAIDYLIKKNEWSEEHLARKVKCSQPHIGRLRKGEREGKYKLRQSIAQAFGYNIIDFLALGRQLIEGTTPEAESLPEHPLVVTVNSEHEQEFLQKRAEFYRGIPLYESGKLAAGINGLAFDPYEEPSSTVIVYGQELRGRLEHNLKALRVGGDAMEPVIPKGSIVVVDVNDREFVDTKIYVVLRDEGDIPTAAVKRVRKTNGGFVLLSENRDYLPEISSLDWPDLCVGRVVWMWRSLEDS